MRVLDGAITVLDGQVGVEPQTETVWRQASAHQVPRIIFINKMDKIGAQFLAATATVQEYLGAEPCIVQLPIGSEDNFTGIIDLVTVTAYHFDGQVAEEMKVIPIPEKLQEQVTVYRTKLIEQLCHYDEKLAEKYLFEARVTVTDIKVALRAATIANKLFPVFCGSAFKNKGIKLLIDGACDYLPSPLDIPPIIGENAAGTEVTCDPVTSTHFVALAFKIMTDPYVGKLTFFRVYSGRLQK